MYLIRWRSKREPNGPWTLGISTYRTIEDAQLRIQDWSVVFPGIVHEIIPMVDIAMDI